MSDLREDPLTGRRVLIAENRAGRPSEFASPAHAGPAADAAPRADCVFCPGSEEQTPDATLEIVDENGDWRVRAFPNKYPAVELGAGRGVHEVIVESRGHHQRTGELGVEQLTRVLEAYSQRLSALAEDRRYPYRLLFKNVGASAGASLTHLHSQLVALPYTPAPVGEELSRLAASGGKRRCGWCERVQAERAAAGRVVLDSDEFVVLCPSASRQPYETWVLPAGHHSWFEKTIRGAADAGRLAVVLLAAVRAIEAEIDSAGYNLIVHTSPAGHERGGHGHWRIEIVPRVASLAGLELATGLFMNVLSPERAAERLRARIAGGVA